MGISEQAKQAKNDQESDVQPDLRMRDCEHVGRVLQLQQSRYYNRLVFRYNPANNYCLSLHILIGALTEVCPHCKALKFNEETKGMCCAAEKIKQPQFEELSEPLKTLIAGYTAESKHFLFKIRKYNEMGVFGVQPGRNDRNTVLISMKSHNINNETVLINGAQSSQVIGNIVTGSICCCFSELRCKQNYNTADLLSYVQSNIPKLMFEQKGIYDQIMQTINNGIGEIFFLDAPGGTGKIFLIRLILAAIRSQNDIALVPASSGIVNAHSALKLPLNTQCIKTPTCNVSSYVACYRLFMLSVIESAENLNICADNGTTKNTLYPQTLRN
ncbi:unnamed protein product [Onchocerca ochengi]|uniref:ATP-dependent DNA helicase n=1 Tax=Onchocerca ochengi TaxID=42157 RepID=A0A182EM82_ONCOC|nr:unnamed protein product [Onchocerca ochengi]